jgi:hypothetical protein
MVGRGELADKAWKQIAPLLPQNGKRGKQFSDHRHYRKRHLVAA